MTYSSWGHSLLKQGIHANRSIELLHYIIMTTWKQKVDREWSQLTIKPQRQAQVKQYSIKSQIPKNSINFYNNSTSSAISVQINVPNIQISNSKYNDTFYFLSLNVLFQSLYSMGLKTLQQGDIFRLVIKLSSFISWVQILLCDSSLPWIAHIHFVSRINLYDTTKCG